MAILKGEHSTDWEYFGHKVSYKKNILIINMGIFVSCVQAVLRGSGNMHKECWLQQCTVCYDVR